MANTRYRALPTESTQAEIRARDAQRRVGITAAGMALRIEAAVKDALCDAFPNLPPELRMVIVVLLQQSLSEAKLKLVQKDTAWIDVPADLAEELKAWLEARAEAAAETSVAAEAAEPCRILMRGVVPTNFGRRPPADAAETSGD